MKVAKMYGTVLLIGLALMIGCSAEARVIGKWVAQGKDGASKHIELFSDKSISWEIPVSETQTILQYGTWTLLSDGRIKADVNIVGVNITVLGEVKGKNLIMDIGGEKLTFAKM